jgi:ATP-dependent protease ClpP protease subunit
MVNVGRGVNDLISAAISTSVDSLDDAAEQAEDAAKRLQDSGVRFKSARADSEKPAGPWYSFKNLADTTAQIDIYDEIDWLWGVTARDFRDELKALPDSVDTIDLHINSPGGDVYEAIAIMNSLRQHPAKVVTTVDGMAASSAGFIAVGASDELIMAENAELMAHLPWAITIGDSADMRKMADDLDRIGKNIASIFVAKAGGKLDDWMATLTAETWWSAAEAVDAGIADKMLKAPKRDAKSAAKNRFNLSVFNHAGRSNAPAPAVRNKTPQPVEAEVTQEKETTVATLSATALEKLGLDGEADEAAINAAIESLPDEGDVTPPEPTLDQAAQIVAQAGMATIDAEALQSLQEAAALGAQAHAQQVREADERIVDAAIAAGKFPPARREHHLNALAADREGHTAVINGLATGLVPLAESGHGVSAEITNEDDAIFASLYGKESV